MLGSAGPGCSLSYSACSATLPGRGEGWVGVGGGHFSYVHTIKGLSEGQGLLSCIRALGLPLQNSCCQGQLYCDVQVRWGLLSSVLQLARGRASSGQPLDIHMAPGSGPD